MEKIHENVIGKVGRYCGIAINNTVDENQQLTYPQACGMAIATLEGLIDGAYYTKEELEGRVKLLRNAKRPGYWKVD